jgi:predicted nucleotidyltransferase
MIKRSEIRKYARTIGRHFQPERVVLFGSYARGKATEDSDVDLLVIMDHDRPRNVDQAIAIRLAADAPFPMDLLVKRPSELAERLAMNDSFFRGLMEDGAVLYE